MSIDKDISGARSEVGYRMEARDLERQVRENSEPSHYSGKWHPPLYSYPALARRHLLRDGAKKYVKRLYRRASRQFAKRIIARELADL